MAVALHPEGVDRNSWSLSPANTGLVALPPEGVDRNLSTALALPHFALVAFHLKGAGRTQIVTLDFWT